MPAILEKQKTERLDIEKAIEIILVHGMLCSNARELHFLLETALMFHHDGRWGREDVSRELVVPDRGDGRRGRVDLFVDLPGRKPVAIEIDRGGPRAKSLFKLRSLHAWRVVVLRGTDDGRWHMPSSTEELRGIDAVVGVHATAFGNRVLYSGRALSGHPA